MTHTTFQEVMEGTVRLGGRSRAIRLELGVDLPEVFRPWGDASGVLRGRVSVEGWADDPLARGTLRVAPIAARRIRYRLDFTTDDGRAMHLDGWKSVSYRRPLHSMTYLPATITDDAGEVVGEARLRFDVRRDLASFLAGFRLRSGGRDAGKEEAAYEGGGGPRRASSRGSVGRAVGAENAGLTDLADGASRPGSVGQAIGAENANLADGASRPGSVGRAIGAENADVAEGASRPGAAGRAGRRANAGRPDDGTAAKGTREADGVDGPDQMFGPEGSDGLLRSRWRGQAGRLEVWYTTLTDPATGTGVWIHHELVAPSDGGAPYAHGWAALFPPGEPPVLDRFGPHPWTPSRAFTVPGVELHPSRPAASGAARPLPDAVPAATAEPTPGAGPLPEAERAGGGVGSRLLGRAGSLAWDLEARGGGVPLWTFPRWAWRRETLPAAQVVSAPSEVFDGTVRCGDRVLDLRGAPGATARIYGHGNAKRWAWLHADLGEGDVCEVVAAVSTRRGLDRLPPLPFVRLRVGGTDWPAAGGLLTATRMRASIGLPSWKVTGRSGDRMIRVEVTQPPGETVAVDYTDPDGSPAVCHNSERADAVITLLRRSGRRWELDRRWHLHGTAHAEVGLR